MDSPNTLNGIQQLLMKLDEDELLGLASTVTQGLSRNKLEKPHEAIEVILKYSPNIDSILRRKVITKDLLFEYLRENKVSVSFPTTKNALIDAACTYWNLKQPVPCHLFSTSTLMQYEDKSQSFDISALALKFSEWFYMMMNQNCPIDEQHFWEDAKLQLNLISGLQTTTRTVNDSTEEIVRVLFQTKCEHLLYFNPNFSSDGIQGRIDPYGLVAVLACGILHSNNLCVGVFEQVFMLARDPFSENNWKIKSTELNLRSKSDVRALPSLCDSSLTSTLLALPSM